jgi:hypothetical protein
VTDQNHDRCANCGALKTYHAIAAATPFGEVWICPRSVYQAPEVLPGDDLKRIAMESYTASQANKDVQAHAASARTDLEQFPAESDMSDLMRDDVSSPPRKG